MNLFLRRLGVALMVTALTGACTTIRDFPAAPTRVAETIGYSVGPCFGLCPVYSLEAAPDGAVRFTGERHTAVLGARQAQRPAAAVRRLADALAPFRPATGTSAETTCDNRASDMSSYTITWTAANGARTTLRHDRGCMSETNARLNAVLTAAPETLGIADWTRQTSRPGASRG